jgi:hypothetical protein
MSTANQHIWPAQFSCFKRFIDLWKPTPMRIFGRELITDVVPCFPFGCWRRLRAARNMRRGPIVFEIGEISRTIRINLALDPNDDLSPNVSRQRLGIFENGGPPIDPYSAALTVKTHEEQADIWTAANIAKRTIH